MLEYGEAYLESREIAQDEVRRHLSEEAFQVALSMSFDSTETEIEAVHMEPEAD